MTKFTLTDFLKRFPHDNACLEEIKKIRFPEGITCPKCQSIQKFYRVRKRTAYACSVCGSHVYPLVGTIFEKTTTSLRLWFYAMYLMSQTRAGISAKQLQRELGVTYKTAWRIFKQIRLLMGDNDQLSGVVEVDETFVGGKGKNQAKLWHGNSKEKEVVMGMVERKGRARLKHVPNTGKRTLLKEIKKTVKPGSMIMSDELTSYKNLYKLGYDHSSVNHSAGEFRRDDVYTQNIESIWSTFKRGIIGVYRHVGRKYLQSYANEYAFRYNYRKTPGLMFDVLLSRVSREVEIPLSLELPKIPSYQKSYFEEVF